MIKEQHNNKYSDKEKQDFTEHVKNIIKETSQRNTRAHVSLLPGRMYTCV